MTKAKRTIERAICIQIAYSDTHTQHRAVGRSANLGGDSHLGTVSRVVEYIKKIPTFDNQPEKCFLCVSFSGQRKYERIERIIVSEKVSPP